MKYCFLLLLASIFMLSNVQAAPPYPCNQEVGNIEINELGKVDIPFEGTSIVATPQAYYFLRPGQCLVSPNRERMAVMQSSDGNFVVYYLPASENHSLWSTKTGGHPGAGLLVQQDGHFVIYDNGGITEIANTCG